MNNVFFDIIALLFMVICIHKKTHRGFIYSTTFIWPWYMYLIFFQLKIFALWFMFFFILKKNCYLIYVFTFMYGYWLHFVQSFIYFCFHSIHDLYCFLYLRVLFKTRINIISYMAIWTQTKYLCLYELKCKKKLYLSLLIALLAKW